MVSFAVAVLQMKEKTLQAELKATQQQLRLLERATEGLEPYLLAGQLALGYLHDENSTLSMLAMYLTFILKQSETSESGRREKRELIQQVAETVDVMQVRHSEMWLMVRERDQSIALTDCVRNSTSLVGIRFDRQDITLTKRISLEAGKLKVPSHSYRTILIYLLWDCLGNRLNRGGQVIIEAFVDGDALVLAVVDEGRGRDANLSTDIWGPGSTKDHSGLGLWFVKKAVDRLGGTITLENDVAGAKFLVRAPLKQSEIDE